MPTRFSVINYAANHIFFALRDRFALREMSPMGDVDRADSIDFIDREMETVAGSRHFMAELCREGDAQCRRAARWFIYQVFLKECEENGSILRSCDENGHTIAESWWTLNTVPTFVNYISLLLEFVTSTFWYGLCATGWRKLLAGLKLFLAVKATAPKKDGKPTAFLMLENMAVARSHRRKKYGAAHMMLGCSAADSLNMPIMLCVPDPSNIAFYELFGFRDMGQIPGLPRKFDYYHWMVREPCAPIRYNCSFI
jgi:hypothetical protein